MKIGIFMSDFRLGYLVSLELKKRGIKYEILQSENEIDKYPLVISNVLHGRNIIFCDNPENCARKAVAYTYGKRKFKKIVVGIDPGPKPGIAVVGDGYFVEEIQLSNLWEVRRYIDSISEGYEPEYMIIRIGDGDIVNRNRIVNALIGTYPVELVDERNTSESITNKDVESAKAIAFSRGKMIRDKLNTVIREGYIRELQRRSRIESNGKITISRALAKDVAQGKLSLEEAIERMRRKDEKR